MNVRTESGLRPRSSHYHDSCGHWCFKYTCRAGQDCGKCRTKPAAVPESE